MIQLHCRCCSLLRHTVSLLLSVRRIWSVLFLLVCFVLIVCDYQTGPPQMHEKKPFVTIISHSLFRKFHNTLCEVMCDFVMVPFFLSIFHRFPSSPHVAIKFCSLASRSLHCAPCNKTTTHKHRIIAGKINIHAHTTKKRYNAHITHFTPHTKTTMHTNCVVCTKATG